MTERKFTPPTEFPAEDVDGEGNKAVVLGIAPNCSHPFIGYDYEGEACAWTEEGSFVLGRASPYNLYDIPNRITAWHNVYYDWIGRQWSTRSEADGWPSDDRLCVYRIERDEDGSNPKIFVEGV